LAVIKLSYLDENPLTKPLGCGCCLNHIIAKLTSTKDKQQTGGFSKRQVQRSFNSPSNFLKPFSININLSIINLMTKHKTTHSVKAGQIIQCKENSKSTLLSPLIYHLKPSNLPVVTHVNGHRLNSHIHIQHVTGTEKNHKSICNMSA